MFNSNPFSPENDGRSHQDVPEVTIRGARSSSTSKEGVPTETDSLLGKRRTPPPRYSAIDDAIAQSVTGASNVVGVHNNGNFVGQPTETVNFPQAQNTSVSGLNPQQGCLPAWIPWIPGPGQYYPPGLEHLAGLEEVTIKGRGSTYRILRDECHQIFTARVIQKGCCGGGRDGDASVRVLNNANLEVLSLTRSLDSTGCCGRSNEHVEITFPPGVVIGVVQGCKSEYTVHNPSGDVLFIIGRQPSGCCRKGGYEISSPERYTLGLISASKRGCCASRGARLTFPCDLDLRSKALLLAAAISVRNLDRV